jgi:hypothetical protein
MSLILLVISLHRACCIRNFRIQFTILFILELFNRVVQNLLLKEKKEGRVLISVMLLWMQRPLLEFTAMESLHPL